MIPRILVVDDEESIRFTFEKFLTGAGYRVETVGSFEEGLEKIATADFDLVFTDIILGRDSGVRILQKIRENHLPSYLIFITGYPDIDTASEAVRLGAFDYLAKPVKKDALLRVTDLALRHKRIADENEQYRSNLEAVFRSVKDCIITVDRNLALIALNDAARNCGFSAEDIGKPFDLFPACDGRCLKALREAMETNRSIEVHRSECRRAEGTERIVNLTASPLVDKDLLFGAVLVVRDETRVVTLERGLKERSGLRDIVGASEKMRKIYSLVENLANVQTSVLITGESGTGKELLAEAIHYEGERRKKPLVKVNCSALSESLLESELFGHVKGAFTGAAKDKIGRFQMAGGGTIFLDEIGDISPGVQKRLLRVLQEMEFERVGDSKPIKVDVRVIAATNKNLIESIKTGEFREDLYYRLNIVEVTLPPLRERREDIPLLANHFIEKFNIKFEKKVTALSDDVLRTFMDHSWPGNIRQLAHTIEHAFILCNGAIITMEHLPTDFRQPVERGKPPLLQGNGSDEPRAIYQALEKAAWNKARAARLLGMSRRTIYRKMKEHGIPQHETPAGM